MAKQPIAEQSARSGHTSLHASLSSYKSATDHEVREYSRSLSDYERNLEQAARRASKPRRLPFFRSGESRTSDSRTVNRLLKEWENDRTMSSVLGNGERPVRNQPAEGVASRPGAYSFHQARPGAAPAARPRIVLADEPGRLERLLAYLGHVRQIPVMIAAAVTLATALSAFFVPATLITGLLASHPVALPMTADADQALFEYSTPMSESMASVDISDIDTSKFDMLTLRDYELQAGETLSHVANRFNLRLDTLISFNNIANPRIVVPGTKYKIPNRDGLLHKVQAGDTLDTIAKKYGVSVTALLDGNNLSDVNLSAGSSLFIPDARMNSMDLKMLLGELFIWPVWGGLSSTFGYRTDPFTGVRMFHNGIDIPGAIGSPIRAGMEGRVISVQSQVGNYGKVIILQHPRGFRTLYGHLSAFKVGLGDYVSQGQIIGLRGNSGRTTGPHLHFSVIKNGQYVNPLNFLK